MDTVIILCTLRVCRLCTLTGFQCNLSWPALIPTFRTGLSWHVNADLVRRAAHGAIIAYNITRLRVSVRLRHYDRADIATPTRLNATMDVRARPRWSDIPRGVGLVTPGFSVPVRDALLRRTAGRGAGFVVYRADARSRRTVTAHKRDRRDDGIFTLAETDRDRGGGSDGGGSPDGFGQAASARWTSWQRYIDCACSGRTVNYTPSSDPSARVV